jgi:hypothetical protein
MKDLKVQFHFVFITFISATKHSAYTARELNLLQQTKH